VIRLKRMLLRSFGMTIAFLWGLFLAGQLAIATDLPEAQAQTPPSQLIHAIAQLPPSPTVDEPLDYFDQIQKVKVGYLLWTEFPVRVAIDPAGDPRWQTAVRHGVEAWQPYFPIDLLAPTDSRRPNIRIQATRFKVVRPAGSTELPRIRAAETRYSILPISHETPVLHHEMTIALPPGQADGVMQSAACHEMGHALGLWGHSINKQDVMYFAQVKTPPPISARDLRTLKRIYEQPTRLGGILKS
jgi:predicted Zn-dependent protease